MITAAVGLAWAFAVILTLLAGVGLLSSGGEKDRVEIVVVVLIVLATAAAVLAVWGRPLP